MPTELEQIIAEAADLAKHKIQASIVARADLKRLLDAGQHPNVVAPAPDFEVLVQLRSPQR